LSTRCRICARVETRDWIRAKDRRVSSGTTGSGGRKSPKKPSPWTRKSASLDAPSTGSTRFRFRLRLRSRLRRWGWRLKSTSWRSSAILPPMMAKEFSIWSPTTTTKEIANSAFSSFFRRSINSSNRHRVFVASSSRLLSSNGLDPRHLRRRK